MKKFILNIIIIFLLIFKNIFSITNSEIISTSSNVIIYIPKLNNSMFCWGKNDVGQCGLGFKSSIPIKTPTLMNNNSNNFFNKKIIQICNSVSGFNFALTDDGGIYSWGANNFGILGRNKTYEELNYDLNPNLFYFNLINKPQFIFCGSGFHGGFITNSSKVYGFGDNSFGVMGEISKKIYLTPTIINGTENFNIINLCQGKI